MKKVSFKSLAKNAKKRFYIIIKKERIFLAKIAKGAKKSFYIIIKKKEDLSQIRKARKEFIISN